MHPRSSIPDRRSLILDPRSLILKSRSLILDPRSLILKPRSPIRDPRSVILAALLCLIPAISPAQEFDLVIRSGRVLDGAGNPWILADVAIKDGRFAKIGRVEGKGQREIDARGKYVTPGWI